MAEQWEYLTRFIKAEATSKEIKEYLKDRLDTKRPPRYAPEAMIPELNQLGKEGWELVQMEPVARVGRKGNILFTGEGRRWSNVFFCVFKRLRQSAPMATLPPVEVAQPPAHPTPGQPDQPPTPHVPKVETET